MIFHNSATPPGSHCSDHRWHLLGHEGFAQQSSGHCKISWPGGCRISIKQAGGDNTKGKVLAYSWRKISESYLVNLSKCCGLSDTSHIASRSSKYLPAAQCHQLSPGSTKAVSSPAFCLSKILQTSLLKVKKINKNMLNSAPFSMVCKLMTCALAALLHWFGRNSGELR